jgi:hypothetical protein
VKRRTFIAGLGSAAVWPVVVRAQQGDRVRRIGLLLSGDENDPVWKPRLSAFMQALADLGWTDGRNMRMDLRWHSGANDQRAHSLLGQPCKRFMDIPLSTCTQHINFDSEGAGSHLHIFRPDLATGIGRVDKQADHGRRRN